MVSSLVEIGSEISYITYITEESFERVQEIMDNSDKLEKKVPFDKLVYNEYNKK